MSKRISTFINARGICPSGYYRILQFFEPEELKVHQLMTPRHFRWWHKRSASQKRLLAPFHFLIIILRTMWGLAVESLRSSQGDVVIINRTVSPRLLLPTHRWLMQRIARRATVIWDFDDNMLDQGIISRAEHDLLSEVSHRIVVTHQFLADTIAPEYRDKVAILPTTDGSMCRFTDDELIEPRLCTYASEIRLVWLGTAGNLVFLRSIIPQLDRFADELLRTHHKRLSLHVVCNQKLSVVTSTLQVVNTDWTHEAGIQALRDAHIGIMPLADNEFTRGKGGFKLIQCLAAALPVVASNVGFNTRVINDRCGRLVSADVAEADWTTAIITFCTDADAYRAAAVAAREQYFERFNYNAARQQWRSWVQE